MMKKRSSTMDSERCKWMEEGGKCTCPPEEGCTECECAFAFVEVVSFKWCKNFQTTAEKHERVARVLMGEDRESPLRKRVRWVLVESGWIAKGANDIRYEDSDRIIEYHTEDVWQRIFDKILKVDETIPRKVRVYIDKSDTEDTEMLATCSIKMDKDYEIVTRKLFEDSDLKTIDAFVEQMHLMIWKCAKLAVRADRVDGFDT